MGKVGWAAAAAVSGALAAGPATGKILDVRTAAKSPRYELRCGGQAQPFVKISDVTILNMAPGSWKLRRDDGRVLYIETGQGLCILEEQR